MAAFRITFFCPDTNIKISGSLAERVGMGGGKVAIVRMAEALALLGNAVTVFGHVEEERHKGVEYIGVENFRDVDTDVLIVITGSKCDLSGLDRKSISARLKIVWLSGSAFIANIKDNFYDFYYANSVFLRKRAISEWGLPAEKVLTTHQGLEPNDFAGTEGPCIQRDLFGIVFASHPGKGLSRIVDVIERLRTDVDGRFHLAIYGGYKLWNDSDERKLPRDIENKGWIYHGGILPEAELCKKLFHYNFMLHLTDYEDTSSILIQQAKKAGVLVIASDVGGNSELIENGYDGFLIGEHYLDEQCYVRLRALIQALLEDHEYAGYIRENAKKHQRTWQKTAQEWMDHWDEVLHKKRRKRVIVAGYYGYKNLGDEAILKCVIDEIKRDVPDVAVTAVSADPYETEKMHGVKSVWCDDFPLLAKEVEKSDLVLLGGGGLFQDHHTMRIAQFFEDHRYGVTRYANLPLMARIYQKPVLYYSHGVGPLFSKESFLFSQWAFGLADHISVRDEFSYHMLVELLAVQREKVELNFDPVLKTPFPSKERAKSLLIYGNIPVDRKYIIVAPRFWINKGLEEKVICELTEALRCFLKENAGYYAIFVPFHIYGGDEDDKSICQKISENLPEGSSALINHYTRYEEILSLYRWADFSIGMRYHSVILSAIAGTPVIALSYDKKVDEFMRDLPIRDKSMCIDIKDISRRAILDLMKFVQERREIISGEIRRGVEEILKKRRRRQRIGNFLWKE